MNFRKIDRNYDELKYPFRKKNVFLLIFVVVIVGLGISYALFSETLIGKKTYTVESNGLGIHLDESQTGNNILLQNALPVSDDEGLENEAYDFSLVNEEKQDLAYTIYLKEEEYDNKTPASAIKYYYTRDVDQIKVMRHITDQTTEDGRYYLETGIIPGESTYHYTFRMWIDYKAGNEVLNTKYSVHLEVYAEQTIQIYKEDILKGTDPVLSDRLIPVTIDADGTVKKASLYKEWYNYGKKEWANAVVLEDINEDYKSGEVIPEDKIESYFVWIPRYRYKIFNDGNYTGLTSLNPDAPQTIEIEFESKDTPVSNGTIKDEWLSHPSFQVFDTNGFWVGKFESGYRGATTTEEAQMPADSSMLVIKPNTYSWRNITVGNMFRVGYDYLRDNESHMMKNTEWGAVAYLQHSTYGSHGSVRTNNNNSYSTGYASVTEPTIGSNDGISIEGNLNGITSDVTLGYNTTTGYIASTTSNISGIYDMSGGAWEYVMGYNVDGKKLEDQSKINNIYTDFIENPIWKKYYDAYYVKTDSPYQFYKRILGDATGEMGPFKETKTRPESVIWYNDSSYFPTYSWNWFARGGGWVNGIESGIFTFSYDKGGNKSDISFRVVLTPIK